jgi:hypothetical protein
MIESLTGAYNLDDSERAKRGKPPVTHIGKLFSLHADALRIVHEHADRVLLWDDIDNAQGRTLDRYGANFGVARQGAPDVFYRLLIKVKMLAQLSGGDIDTVLNASAELLGVPPAALELVEIFPAKIWIYVDRDRVSPDAVMLIDLVWAMVHRIVAAGVGIRLMLRVYATRTFDVFVHAGAITRPRVTVGPPLAVLAPPDRTLYGFGQAITVRVTCEPR